jgi:hypothetical protein
MSVMMVRQTIRDGSVEEAKAAVRGLLQPVRKWR